MVRLNQVDEKMVQELVETLQEEKFKKEFTKIENTKEALNKLATVSTLINHVQEDYLNILEPVLENLENNFFEVFETGDGILEVF